MRTPQHRPGKPPLYSLLPCLTLWACLSGPAATEVTDQRTAAVGFVLTERATVFALAKRCRYDPVQKLNLEAPARAAAAAWSERKGDQVQAANAYLEDFVAVAARRSGRSAAADQQRQLTRDYAARGEQLARQTIAEGGGRGACADLLGLLTRGDLDLASPEFDPVLEALVEKYVRSDPRAGAPNRDQIRD